MRFSRASALAVSVSVLAGVLVAVELRTWRDTATAAARHSSGAAALVATTDHAEAGPIAELAPAPAEVLRSVAPANADAERESCRISTRDTTGKPAAGVEIFMASEREARRVAISDDAGEASVAPWDEPKRLVLRASGFQVAVHEVPHPTPARIEIVLTTEAEILGRVVFGDGTPAGPGLHVVAQVASEIGSAALASQRVAAAHPEVLGDRTAADGSFRIRGLQPATRYSVTAGGLGLVSAPRTVVESGTSTALIHVQRLFGARLRFRAADGGETVHVAPQLFGESAGLVRYSGSEATLLSGISLPVRLAGVELDAPGGSAVDRLVLLTSDRELDLIGPLRFEARFPGYEALELDFEARRIERDIASIEVPLTATASCFGTLSIDLVAAPESLSSIQSNLLPDAFVKLRSDTGERIEYALLDCTQRPLEIRGVPCGTYRATFELTVSHWRFPPRGEPAPTLEISERPALFSVFFDDVGGLAIDVSRADLSAYGGPLVVSYRDDAWGDVEQIRLAQFERAPYVLSSLKPGTYRVWVSSALGQIDAQAPQTVHVAAGACTSASFALADPRR